jgi:two-component system chemotaxis response regulator CheB
MPQRALDRVPSAMKIPLNELPSALDRMSRENAGPARDVPDALRIEVALTERAMPEDDWNTVPGMPSRFTCPDCLGALQAIEEDGTIRYRCRVGHAYSAADLLAEKSVALEDSIWLALQTLEERAEMLRTMERSDRARGWDQIAAGFARRADEAVRHAGILRAALRDLSQS